MVSFDTIFGAHHPAFAVHVGDVVDDEVAEVRGADLIPLRHATAEGPGYDLVVRVTLKTVPSFFTRTVLPGRSVP